MKEEAGENNWPISVPVTLKNFLELTKLPKKAPAIYIFNRNELFFVIARLAQTLLQYLISRHGATVSTHKSLVLNEHILYFWGRSLGAAFTCPSPSASTDEFKNDRWADEDYLITLMKSILY